MSESVGNYGYIEFIDERKLKNDGYDDQIEPEIRKPTLAEREEIVINYIKAHSGRILKIGWLAQQLAVSDRTIHSLQCRIELYKAYCASSKRKA